MEESLGWNLWVQDLRGWKPFQGRKKPRAQAIYFKTKAEAAAEKSRRGRHDDLIMTIAPVPPPQSRPARERRRDPTTPDPMGGKMNTSGRRLTE